MKRYTSTEPPATSFMPQPAIVARSCFNGVPGALHDHVNSDLKKSMNRIDRMMQEAHSQRSINMNNTASAITSGFIKHKRTAAAQP